MMLDGGKWHTYRLPKASHTYDGAHGWNTEWPRIREIGEGNDLLMTMHGMFWKFPKSFSAANASGIRPRSTYLKVIGDFTKWNDRVVFGCDDTANSEFLNKRKAKGNLAGPGQSQSNLWFVEPARIDQLGPAVGQGAVWVNEDVKGGEWSDPFLFAGYERRAVHLAHASETPVTLTFESSGGNGTWRPIGSVTVPAKGYVWTEFTVDQTGEWVRVKSDRDMSKGTVSFHYSNADRRTRDADPIFKGLAKSSDSAFTGGLVRARGENLRTLHVAAMTIDGASTKDVGYYELDGEMKLRKVEDPTAHGWVKKNVAIPNGVINVDEASVLFIDDAGKRWRLPKGDPSLDATTGVGLTRIDREVATERDLFNAHGTFYELPAENAGGFAKVRPVATHNRRIHDYCSYRGLLILTGIDHAAAGANPHVVRSEDGKAAVWAGVVDDLWKFGKAVGQGGPWKNTRVDPDVPSDPYLMNNYDAKKIALSHDAAETVTMRVEVDPTGEGLWMKYRSFEVKPGATTEHPFPASFHAHWARVVADKPCSATAWLTYE
jgi:hypothetical protein